MTMQRLAVTVTKKHALVLQRGAAKYGISVSEYLRRLLDSYLALHGGHGGYVDESEDEGKGGGKPAALLDVG
jgi:hypothetical protein